MMWSSLKMEDQVGTGRIMEVLMIIIRTMEVPLVIRGIMERPVVIGGIMEAVMVINRIIEPMMVISILMEGILLGLVAIGRYRGRAGRGHEGSRGRGHGQGRGPNEEDHGFGNDNQVIGDNQHLDSQGQGEGSVIRDERQLRNGNWNYGGERRGNGGGNLGFRVREGPLFRERDGRNNGRDESMDNSDKKEAGDGNGMHATNVEDNTNGAEKNVLETIEVSKNVEPEQGKLDQLASQDDSKKKAQEEEEENNIMTLDEYEKLLIEKRKALEALKIEERKVALDKDFELMQLVEKKKEDSLFIKLNSEKDKLKKDSLDKDDKVRKVKSQQLLLGEIHIRGSGRGRGRRDPGGYRGGYSRRVAAVPAIGDSGQFPDLAKPVKA
ncbi:hypothetical protein F0562_021701 [Nyssa sinensis]|uniref:Hyaluronan/mRNA-binding protein domain-containing protein n=1 Tax=Nyssa sinensis TaxID=561372 RepID=A0A5J5BKE7_9ASTE|nr:hypothetical protein F0562_021701 [Nyssa sinensis]